MSVIDNPNRMHSETLKFFLITTNASYRGKYIQSQVTKLKGNVLLMIDEAHNFGAVNLNDKLHFWTIPNYWYNI